MCAVASVVQSSFLSEMYYSVQLKVEEDVDAQTWRCCEGSLWEIDVTDIEMVRNGVLGFWEEGSVIGVSTADEA